MSSRPRPVDSPEPLEARQIDASNERLISEAVGEVELEDNVLVIKRIHVRLRLRLMRRIERQPTEYMVSSPTSSQSTEA